MNDSDEMEDISSLEDNPAEADMGGTTIIVGEGLESLAPDTPVYRLRLFYSHETFFAAFHGEPLSPKSMVLVPTRYGRDLAQIISRIERNAAAPALPSEIARIDRLAGPEDLDKARYNHEQEKEAFNICKEKIALHKLDMKLVSVHYLLDEPKVLFFFTAESRVDFRDLVKDLVSIFKTRIELRQIGVRDESRVVGGLGVCGRGYCCHTISDKLKPVSIKMAKDQNLSLNSMKISGPCGRLLCCLAYEFNFYNEQRRIIPQEGCKILYDNTAWRVVEVNVVMGKIRMASEDGRMIQIPSACFEKVDNRWRISESARKEVVG
ncbi:MAG: hypothetical protein LBP76_03260 [Treponema sp.]|jgi:cell fate regulator YaaT (PSP1 superfamily)|nr:hypothetical protein [Treponema sp.]